ncbi:TackOD1 domain-containing metal-binding protein [Bradyrhizobium monzae]
MQVKADASICPACKAAGLTFVPTFHHMICAYVGPIYDFAKRADSYVCPKCQRNIISGDQTCEIVGTSALCSNCGREMIASQPIKAVGR